jgi:peptidyl-prolyl cis-trans isomerase D
MALIGTLRNKMTKWVVGFVAVAIISFILNDLFGNSSTALFGGQDNSVGTISGDRISLEEWQRTLSDLETNYTQGMGRAPGEREMTNLREQAWTLLIAKHAVRPEYEKVGSEVTDEEMFDMLTGRNVDENLKMAYTDSVGNFDKNRMLLDLQNIDASPAGSEQRKNWDRIKSQMIAGRERVKFENLLVKTAYVTKAQAEQQYHLDNDVAEIKFLYVPYYAVKDSAAPVDQAAVKKYYDDNKKKYKTEETRSLSYVSLPADPSRSDTVGLRTDMEKLAIEFRGKSGAAEDSVFASLNSEDSYTAYTKYDKMSLPTYINPETMMEGLVLGPFLDNGRYKIVKVVKIGTDTVYQMKASHILIQPKDQTDASKKEAKDKASKVLAELKGGADFALKALEYSDDQSNKTRGGDLGWFRTGMMVPEFEKPIKAATKTGLINQVVETSFGYHIINVTAPKDNSSYTIATIEQSLIASQETLDSVYRKSDLFAGDLDGVEEFKARAKEQNLSVYEANNLKATERFVGNLGEARQIVSWLYRDATVGKVSNIFDLDNNVYVIAVMTGKADAGFRPLDDALKTEIGVIVRKEAQAKVIIDKISGDASLEELAKAFPRDAVVSTSSGVKMIASNIPAIGYDPIAVGKSFSVENGKRTKPFAGESGVTIIEVQSKTIAPAMGDYSIQKSQLQQAANGRGGLEIVDAIKEKSSIEDKRYKVY